MRHRLTAGTARCCVPWATKAPAPHFEGVASWSRLLPPLAAVLERGFAEVARRYNMEWRVSYSTKQKRVALLVRCAQQSRQGCCGQGVGTAGCLSAPELRAAGGGGGAGLGGFARHAKAVARRAWTRRFRRTLLPIVSRATALCHLRCPCDVITALRVLRSIRH